MFYKKFYMEMSENLHVMNVLKMSKDTLFCSHSSSRFKIMYCSASFFFLLYSCFSNCSFYLLMSAFRIARISQVKLRHSLHFICVFNTEHSHLLLLLTLQSGCFLLILCNTKFTAGHSNFSLNFLWGCVS